MSEYMTENQSISALTVADAMACDLEFFACVINALNINFGDISELVEGLDEGGVATLKAITGALDRSDT